MESVSIAHHFALHWSLRNPFLPYRRVETQLYHGYPTHTQWTVSIAGTHRRYFDRTRSFIRHTWPLSLRIECDEGPARAEYLHVQVSVRGIAVINWNGSYVFDNTNGRSFTCDGESIQSETDLLEIEVVLCFPMLCDVIALNRLLLLSRDLGELLDGGQYSDLELQPADGEGSIRVHSCILRARWTNFFARTEIVNRTVETGISRRVLSDLLTYLYTAADRVVRGRSPSREEYNAEVFQVIERYELEHLRKRFLPERCKHVRLTIRDINVYPRLFALPFERLDLAPQYLALPDTLVHYRLEYEPLARRIKCALTLRSEDKLYARLNLVFIPAQQRAPVVVYEESFETEEERTFRESYIALSGQCRELHESLRRNDRGQLFRFVLCLSTGKEDEEVSVVDDLTFAEDREKRLRLLANHMDVALKTQFHRGQTDLRLVCPTDEEDIYAVYFLHKAIFAARVPRWRRVLQESWEGNPIPPDVAEIPDQVYCELSSAGLEPVLNYIYTGRDIRSFDYLYSSVRRFILDGGIVY